MIQFPSLLASKLPFRYLEHKSHRIPLILAQESLLAGVRSNLGNPSRDEKVQKHCFFL